jgi:hypothetical protein
VTTTDWTQDEIDDLMAELDAALADAEAARLLWRQSEAACAQMHAQRDEALAILRELVRDSADSGCVSVAMGRARKLVGGGKCTPSSPSPRAL